MSTAPLEQFIKKYQTAKSYNSKEIRLTLQESEELSIAVALILASTATLTSKIIELQDQLLQNEIQVEISGSKF